MTSSEPAARHDPASSTAPAQAASWSLLKRVRMATHNDFRAAYTLISEYVQHPERAHCVEEFVIDPGCVAFDWMNEPPVPTAAVAFNERTHNMMVQLAEELGLPRDTTNEILQALELKKEELNGVDGDESNPPATRARMTRISTRTGRGGIPNYEDAVIVLLIALCPNITTLRFHYIDLDTPLAQFLVLNNYGQLPKPFLQKVEHVQLHPITGSSDDDRLYAYLRTLDDFRYVHRLPAVQSLSLEGFEDYQPDETQFPRKTSGITKIVISHCDMSGEMIGTIMLIPKQLHEFSLSTDCLRTLDLDAILSGPRHCKDNEEEYFYTPDEDEEEPSDTQAVIGTREWCLQQDKKDCSHGPLWADQPANRREYPTSAIGPLDEFTAMTHLSIRIGTLLDYDNTQSPHASNQPTASQRLIDLLPPNLEFLRLYGYKKGERPEVDEQVEELWCDRAEKFPKLEELQGVDEHLPGVPGSYPSELFDEEDLWVRPREGTNWVRIRPRRYRLRTTPSL